MDFNNYIFFKSENDYAQLKIELNFFLKNFMSIIKKVDRCCDRIKRNYINKLNDVKQRLNHKFKKSLYRDFIIYVTLYALRRINKQYIRLFNV